GFGPALELRRILEEESIQKRSPMEPRRGLEVMRLERALETIDVRGDHRRVEPQRHGRPIDSPRTRMDRCALAYTALHQPAASAALLRTTWDRPLADGQPVPHLVLIPP